jgi:hypothetical protein
VNDIPHEILHQHRTRLFQLHPKVDKVFLAEADAMAVANCRLEIRATPDASVPLPIAVKLVTSSATELQELIF